MKIASDISRLERRVEALEGQLAELRGAHEKLALEVIDIMEWIGESEEWLGRLDQALNSLDSLVSSEISQIDNYR